jgi:hypothetical protein
VRHHVNLNCRSRYLPETRHLEGFAFVPHESLRKVTARNEQRGSWYPCSLSEIVSNIPAQGRCSKFYSRIVQEKRILACAMRLIYVPELVGRVFRAKHSLWKDRRECRTCPIQQTDDPQCCALIPPSLAVTLTGHVSHVAWHHVHARARLALSLLWQIISSCFRAEHGGGS